MKSMKQNQRWWVFQFAVKKNETKIDRSKGVEITAVKSPKNIERQIYIKYNQEIEKEFLGGNCL